MAMNLNHSSRLRYTLWLTAFTIVGAVFAFSDVDEDCIKKHNNTVSNDFLIGTWYKLYQFKLFGVVPTASCPNITFSKPTLEELQGYRDKYKDLDLPHSIGDNSIEMLMFRTRGLIFGESEAKTFVLEPKSKMRINLEGYELYVFKRINDEYAFFWRCAMRGHVKWLLARDKKTSPEEMQELTRNRTEISNMDVERYCTEI